MSMEKMQDEFEAAIAEEAGQSLTAIQLSRKGDSYSTSPLIYAWWAWQASRSSLAIALPGQEKFMNWGRYSEWRINELASLTAQGVKVKP